jgi:hypothetical protein
LTIETGFGDESYFLEGGSVEEERGAKIQRRIV